MAHRDWYKSADVTQGTTAPVSPAFGNRWYNSSASTIAGVPPQSWATWNGSVWKVDTNTGGGGSSTAVTSSATAPASPVLGDRWYNSSGATVSGVPSQTWATWNGSVWKVDTNLQTFVSQTFTASGTWVKPDGLKWARVTVTGGGGGGAGSNGVTGQSGGGVGGNAGATAIIDLAAGSLPAAVAVTVGAAGAAGPGTTAGNGGAGGASSFGAFASANGGAGGLRVAPGTTLIMVEGSAAATAIAVGGKELNGAVGERYIRLAGTESSGGRGAPSYWGGGGRGAGGGGVGTAAGAFGAGGGGAGTSSPVAFVGGAGGEGVVVVDMYF